MCFPGFPYVFIWFVLGLEGDLFLGSSIFLKDSILSLLSFFLVSNKMVDGCQATLYMLAVSTYFPGVHVSSLELSS